MEYDKKYRAGQYIPQVNGFRAFIPKPLPPDIYYDSELMGILSKADRALGRLDGASETLPDADIFVSMYVRKEAVLSSQIEGTQATLLDLMEFEINKGIMDKPSDVGEIVNYISALNYGIQRIHSPKGLPLSLRLFKEIHKHLLKDVRGSERNPGQFRATQNWIGPAGCTLSNATHVPPPPGEDMMEALGNLESFLHSEEEMPELVRIGLAHAQFETIHPFLDGNGRMGRLLITFYLCYKGILKRPLLYISHYFKKNRDEYYKRLQAIRDAGQWEEWLKFFLNGLYEVAQEATEKTRAIVQMREDHRELLMKRLSGTKSTRAISILEKLYSFPFTSVNEVARQQGLNYTSANSIISDLTTLNLLQESSGQKRNRTFVYAPYWELLNR